MGCISRKKEFDVARQTHEKTPVSPSLNSVTRISFRLLLLLSWVVSSTTDTLLFSNGQSAFGDFDTANPWSRPYAFVYDTPSGKMFITDNTANKVYRYGSGALTNLTATHELTFSSTLNAPLGVSDGQGLKGWKNADTLSSTAGSPDYDYTAAYAGTGQTFNPWTPFDCNCGNGDGLLWAADPNAVGGVLLFDISALNATSNKIYAIGYFRIIDPTLAAANRTDCQPIYVVYDATTKSLWVADFGYYRVIRFDNAAAVGSSPTGEIRNASFVVGQPDMNTLSAPASVTASNLNSPRSPRLVYPAGTPTLLVVDSMRNRVLVFQNFSSNGTAADNVLGQSNFGGSGTGITLAGMNAPRGIFYDVIHNQLWVADAGNNRIMEFFTSIPSASPSASTSPSPSHSPSPSPSPSSSSSASSSPSHSSSSSSSSSPSSSSSSSPSPSSSSNTSSSSSSSSSQSPSSSSSPSRSSSSSSSSSSSASSSTSPSPSSSSSSSSSPSKSSSPSASPSVSGSHSPSFSPSSSTSASGSSSSSTSSSNSVSPSNSESHSPSASPSISPSIPPSPSNLASPSPAVSPSNECTASFLQRRARHKDWRGEL